MVRLCTIFIYFYFHNISDHNSVFGAPNKSMVGSSSDSKLVPDPALDPWKIQAGTRTLELDREPHLDIHRYIRIR